jgi:hypothetical protein
MSDFLTRRNGVMIPDKGAQRSDLIAPSIPR